MPCNPTPVIQQRSPINPHTLGPVPPCVLLSRASSSYQYSNPLSYSIALARVLHVTNTLSHQRLARSRTVALEPSIAQCIHTTRHRQPRHSTHACNTIDRLSVMQPIKNPSHEPTSKASVWPQDVHNALSGLRSNSIKQLYSRQVL